jgi:molybdate transport system permease protein
MWHAVSTPALGVVIPAIFLSTLPREAARIHGPELLVGLSGKATAPLESSQRDSSLLVLAAASLTDVLPRVAQRFAESGGVPVVFSFDATSRLAPQTLEGVPADLFFSADRSWMDWVEERGGIRRETRFDLLTNEVVVVVPARMPSPPSGPHGLFDPAFQHIALAGENVPAGRYGQAAMESAGIWSRVADKVVRAGTVRGALEWVALGEADAAVVYRTDAAVEARVRIAFAFPAGSHPPVTYPVAVLARAGRPELAAEFLRFCESGEASEVFLSAGFGMVSPRPGALDSQRSAIGAAIPPSPSDTRAEAHLPNPGSAIRLSFLVALAATIAGFVPAVCLGWVLARKDFFGKSVVATVALVPLVLPPVVTGFILLSLLGTQGPLGAWLDGLGLPIPFTLLGATIAALTVGLPLYVVSVRNAFQAVDPSYEEVAWTLGRRPWPAFTKVTFPLALPGIAAGAVLAFARALGEFGATVVLAGNIEGSTRTIALAVYTLLESPQGRDVIWVLVGASVLLSLLALLGFEALSRHQRKQVGGRRGH